LKLKMINTILLATVAILPLFIFGYLLVNLQMTKSQLFEKVFLGFLISSGLITFFWFILNLLGVPYTIVSFLLLAWSFVLILLLINIISKKLKLDNFNLKSKIIEAWKLPLWMKIIILILLAILGSVLIYNIYWPVKDWDSLVLYDYRAKIFVDTGFMIEGVARGYFFNYPLLTSLSHTWIYLTGITNPMFYYFLLYLSFLIVFYYCLRRYVPRGLSLIGMLFLAVTPEVFQHSQMSYTNLPYTIYLTLAFIYFYIWFNNKKMTTLVISSILLALSTWTRSSEPFWLVPIFLLIIYSFWKRKPLPIVLYLAIFLPIQRIWNIFQTKMLGQQFSTSEMMKFSTSTIFNNISFDRMIEVFVYLYNNVFATWGILGIIFIFIFIYKTLNRRKDITIFFLILTLLSACLLYISAYVFSFTQVDWKGIPDSARRMSIFFLPLIIFNIFLFIGDLGRSVKLGRNE